MHSNLRAPLRENRHIYPNFMAFTSSAFGRGILGVLVAPSAALSSPNTVVFAVVGEFWRDDDASRRERLNLSLPAAFSLLGESPPPQAMCKQLVSTTWRRLPTWRLPPKSAKPCDLSIPHPEDHPDLLPRDSAAFLHSPRPPSITPPPPSPWQCLFTL